MDTLAERIKLAGRNSSSAACFKGQLKQQVRKHGASFKMAFPLCSQVPSALQSGLWCLPVRMLLSEQSRLCPAVGLRPQAPDSDWNLRLGPSPRPAAVTSDRGRGCRGKPKGVEGWAAGNSSEMFLTQALTSCVLSGQPWNLPHPIHHPGIFCKAPSWGWVGEGLGGSGLTVPVPERVQLATLQACLMSAGGSAEEVPAAS